MATTVNTDTSDGFGAFGWGRGGVVGVGSDIAVVVSVVGVVHGGICAVVVGVIIVGVSGRLGVFAT